MAATIGGLRYGVAKNVTLHAGVCLHLTITTTDHVAMHLLACTASPCRYIMQASTAYSGMLHPSCLAVLCPYLHLNSCVSFLVVRVTACDGSAHTSQVVSGLDWVLNNAQQPAVVYLGAPGTGAPDTVLDDAVLAVLQAGISVVVPAGNYNQGTPPDLWTS